MKENLQESRPIDDIENEEGERKEEPRHFIYEQRNFSPIAKCVVLR